MEDGYTQTYDLVRDREYVERLQLAMVEGSEFALESQHGLFGPKRWWQAVRDGSIARHRVDGEIVDVRLNGNWPEFEVDVRGGRTSWCLEGDVERYRIGCGVRIDYVVQRYHTPAKDCRGDSVKVVLEIWVAP